MATPLVIGITGAAGFIGKALAARESARGNVVVGVDLDPGCAAYYRGLGARFMQGDITDIKAMAKFTKGLDRIYHTAAVVRESGDWNVFRRVNVDGPRMVAEAARKNGVGEFVHFSSVMVYGFEFPEGVSEDAALQTCDNPYCDTKLEAEIVLAPYHEPGVFDLYFIRPGDVYGPGSVPWTIRPIEMMKKRLWTYADSRKSIFNHVYIDNLLDGIDTVVANKASGRPFNITDDARTTVRDFFGHYQQWLGIRFIADVPGPVALGLGGVAGRVSSLFRKDLGINREAVRYMLRKHKYSAEAVKALGYRPRVDLEEGMRRTKEWAVKEGLVPA